MKHILAIMLLWSFTAHAASIEDTMREHIRWIADNSHFEPTDTLPEVVYLTPEEMALKFYGAAYLEAKEKGYNTLTVRAMYNHQSHVLYLKEGYDHTRLDTAHELLHELVHHLQAVSGTQYACLRASERDAYRIQTEWMDAHHSPAERPDPFTVLLVSQCHPY